MTDRSRRDAGSRMEPETEDLQAELSDEHWLLIADLFANPKPPGVAIRRDPTDNAGGNVGDEVDFIVNFHPGRYSDVLFSYSQLFGCSFLKKTSGPGAADASQWNAMY